jgi:hypothetical protein
VKRLDPTGTYRILGAMFVLICLVMVGMLSLWGVLPRR